MRKRGEMFVARTNGAKEADAIGRIFALLGISFGAS